MEIPKESMAIDSRASHRCDVPIIETRWSVPKFRGSKSPWIPWVWGAWVSPLEMLETAEVLEVYTLW